jgi:predicted chitinase
VVSAIRFLDVWEEDKKRIEKLQFWKEVKGQHGFPEDIKVWHIHPLGLVENFYEPSGLITLEMLNVVNPGGTDAHHRLILPFLNKYAPLYQINTPLRIAHFLAQVSHESGIRSIEENTGYSITKARELWGCRAQSSGASGYNRQTDSCDTSVIRSKLWTDAAHYTNQPVNLLNYVYGNRMGNGPESSGDGYKYRGRGVIQLTGKSNYIAVTTHHNRENPDDIRDFVANPELLVNDIQYGIESAFIYCTRIRSGFLSAADRDDVRAVTQVVNGGVIGLSDRTARLARLKTHMGI